MRGELLRGGEPLPSDAETGADAAVGDDQEERILDDVAVEESELGVGGDGHGVGALRVLGGVDAFEFDTRAGGHRPNVFRSSFATRSSSSTTASHEAAWTVACASIFTFG